MTYNRKLIDYIFNKQKKVRVKISPIKNRAEKIEENEGISVVYKN